MQELNKSSKEEEGYIDPETKRREADPAWQEQQAEIDGVLEDHTKSQLQTMMLGGIKTEFNYARINDKRCFVEKALEILKNQDYSGNASDLQWRTLLVGCLERMMKTDFKNTKDFYEKCSYFLAGLKEEETGRKKATVKVKGMGERLKTARKKLGWTQKQLADSFKLKSKAAIMNYEKNLRHLPEKMKGWIKKVERMTVMEARKRQTL